MGLFTCAFCTCTLPSHSQLAHMSRTRAGNRRWQAAHHMADTITWLFNDPYEREQTRTGTAASDAQQQRPSQVVRERSVATPEGQHVVVFMERQSTGGTNHQSHFKRRAGGAMSGAERAEKKRKRAALFPDEQAASRRHDAERKRKAAAQVPSQQPGQQLSEGATQIRLLCAALRAVKEAAAHQQEQQEQQAWWDEQQAWWDEQQAYWAARLEEEYWSSLPETYWSTYCCGFRMELPQRLRYVKAAAPSGFWRMFPCPDCGKKFSVLPVRCYGLQTVWM